MQDHQAFDGIRILDLTRTFAGGLASMHIADFGGDVVRVESDGPDTTASEYLAAHRNKRILDRPPSAPELRRLVAAADVVVTDLSAGDADVSALIAERPALVHLDMPPHATCGDVAELPASEALIEAWTGMADQQPGGGDGPAVTVVPIVHYEQGVLGATAITAGLLRRRRTGRGGPVTVTGLHAVSALNAGIMLDLPGALRPYGGGRSAPTGLSPNYRAYRCRDGRWLFLAGFTASFFLLALDVLDAIEVMVLPGVEGDFGRMRTSQGGPAAHELLEARFAQRDRADWLERFEHAGVPSAPVEDREAWAASPTVAANGLLVDGEHDELGAVRLPGPSVDLSATPGRVAWLPDRRAAVTAEAVWTTPPVPATRVEPVTARDEGLPLAGLRVVDLSSYLAGPFTTTILADLGATVLKVEQPSGDEFRVAGASYAAINRGKHQLTADLKSIEGVRRVHGLLGAADVVVENFRHGVAERLGVDHASLAAVNPQLVTCSIRAWGAGPLERTPGFDPLVQARSGLMTAQGGDGPPVLLAVAINDLGSGSVSAFGILAALHARPAIGTGQAVRATLSRTSLVFQAAEFTTVTGRVPDAGASHGAGLLRCSGGWVAVAGDVAGDEEIVGKVADLPVETAVGVLGDCGLAAVAVLARTDVFTAPALVDNDFYASVVDPDFGPIKAVRGFFRWNEPSPAEVHNHALGADDQRVAAAGWNGVVTPR